MTTVHNKDIEICGNIAQHKDLVMHTQVVHAGDKSAQTVAKNAKYANVCNNNKSAEKRKTRQCKNTASA